MLRPRLKSFLSTENIISVILILAAALLPTFMSAYKVSVYSYFYTTALMGLSIALIWGYTGIFSFGQAAFFGIGGYTYGILAKLWGNTALTPVALLIGVALAALVAAILGYFMFYGGINDVFVGLITMCFTIALATFMGQTAGSQWKIGDVALGGFNGLTKIPTLYFGDFKCDKLAFYYVTFIVLAAVYIALRVLKRTKVGYALLAIRENRTRSELFGYNVKKIQVIVFTVGGAIAGLAGVLYAAWGNYITPSNLGLDASTLVVVLVAAGGRKNPTAVLIFSVAYSIIANQLSSSGSQFALIILGLILILVILFVPNGIIASLFDICDRSFARLFAGKGINTLKDGGEKV